MSGGIGYLQELWRGRPQYPADRPVGRGATRQELVLGGVLLCCALCLTLLEYLGASNRMPAAVLASWRSLGRALAGWLPAALAPTLAGLLDDRLLRLAWWSGSCFLYYFAVPALFVRLVLRQRVRDFGLSLQGFRRHLPLYVMLYLLVLPAVIAASYSPAFQHTYPFYGNAHLSLLHLAVWELLYGLQFFSLEFFFRGFLVHGLAPRLGLLAVPVMTVPYCMIHYGKPLPEALAAILAGLVLGTLAYLTRSIWCGFLIHSSVAVTMDVLALGQKGLLGRMLG